MEKLDAFTEKIGYPDKWEDYTRRRSIRGPYVLNLLRLRAWNHGRSIAKIGKPVDRTSGA